MDLTERELLDRQQAHEALTSKDPEAVLPDGRTIAEARREVMDKGKEERARREELARRMRKGGRSLKARDVLKLLETPATGVPNGTPEPTAEPVKATAPLQNAEALANAETGASAPVVAAEATPQTGENANAGTTEQSTISTTGPTTTRRGR